MNLRLLLRDPSRARSILMPKAFHRTQHVPINLGLYHHLVRRFTTNKVLKAFNKGMEIKISSKVGLKKTLFNY